MGSGRRCSEWRRWREEEGAGTATAAAAWSPWFFMASVRLSSVTEPTHFPFFFFPPFLFQVLSLTVSMLVGLHGLIIFLQWACK